MRLLTVIPELQPFLERLRPSFTRKQFRHLARYVIWLVASRRKTIRSIARSTTDRFDQSSLNRFMNSDASETEVLSDACKTMALEDHKDCPGGDILLIIDDTLLEKSGETMESVGYQYSAKDGESILSHDLVSCVMVCSCGQVVPVDLRHYVKAKVFAVPAGSRAAKKRVVVLFDSWYLCKEIVDAIRKRGWHFVSESKSNRKIRVAEGATVKSSDVGLSDDDDGETILFRGRTYLHRELDVYMPSLGIKRGREADGRERGGRQGREPLRRHRHDGHLHRGVPLPPQGEAPHRGVLQGHEAESGAGELHGARARGHQPTLVGNLPRVHVTEPPQEDHVRSRRDDGGRTLRMGRGEVRANKVEWPDSAMSPYHIECKTSEINLRVQVHLAGV